MKSGKVPPYITERARQLRKGQTAAEEKLWAHLRNRRLSGANFRRQQPIGRYIADFYCHEARLVVELQGGIHNRANQRDYDNVRKMVIEQLGIKILSFNNKEVTQDLERILTEIKRVLAPTSS
jgi:very-short-patch-repair endonuclease